MTIPAYTYSGPASTMFFAKEDSTQVATTIAIASGETSPGEGYNFWYDTSANIIKYSSSVNDNWDSGGWSLPLGLGLRSSGIYTSLEQIFNGFGYIGSTIFSLPDVKGLIANGKNSDGSLHNIAFTTSEINMYTFDKNANYNNRIYWLTSSGSLGGLNPNIQYNSQFNKVLYNVDYSQRLYCDIGCFTVINGVVQTFLSKTPFKAVDNWETSLIDDYIIETGISGNQWYELYKSNRLKQGGYSQSGNITFIKPYADTNYTLINGNSKSTTGFTINTGFGDWYSDGKGAQ